MTVVAMMKVGPAFFEGITQIKSKRIQGSQSFLPSDFLTFVPILILFLGFCLIITRLFYLQILRGSYYKNLSEQNRTRTEVIPAPRGIIFDRMNKPLVANSASFKIAEKGKIRLLSKDEALKLIAEGKKIEGDVAREYLYKSALSHVLGYIGQISEKEAILPEFASYISSDFVGKTGLEKQYENILHGENGKKLFEVDSAGKKVRELGTKAPIPGLSLKTTLDLDIGKSVERAMEDIAHGAVVVSDPRNGEVLALYSKPTFNPNIFTQANYKTENGYKTVEEVLTDSLNQPLLDRAIGGIYPPGSTFKLIAATAALEKGSIKPDTKIEDTGILRVGEFSFGNWYFLQYGRTEGNLNVVGAIKRSNDIFFYKTAEKTGIDVISSWAKKFGLGQKLGIDLPGESDGTVPTVEWKEKEIGEQWYLGDTYNYGIGQGYLLATPLQVNMFTTVFANGGTLFRPHLTIDHKPLAINQHFVDKKNIELVREGMAEACDTGGVAWPLFQFKTQNSKLKTDDRDYFRTASDSANMVRIKVACKTGTAEIGGKETKPHAWITVFAPFYKPEIAVTVLVENGGEGSSIAGPIAKKILTDYFEKK